MLNRTKSFRGVMKAMAFLLLFLFPLFSPIYGQEPEPREQKAEEGDTLAITAEDTIVADARLAKDPRKAAIYSAVLPGLGQIYNKKYWKVPIVYLGFGTLGYFIVRNTRYYRDLRQGLIDSTYTLKYFPENLTEDQMTRGKDIYKRYRDLSYISTAGFYILQIIDATVDAYLFDWDVGEDISLRVEPAPLYSLPSPRPALGVRACLSF